jgi:hypothetical protein
MPPLPMTLARPGIGNPFRLPGRASQKEPGMAGESFWTYLLQILGIDPETLEDEIGVLYVPGG